MSRFLDLIERHKIITTCLTFVTPVVILTEIFPADQVQLWVILITLPVALLFIAAYLPEHPGRTWFGTSLLVLAYAVVTVGLVAALNRIFGPQPWYRHLIDLWLGLTLAAVVGRTWVLLADQWRERRHLGGWLRDRSRAKA